MRPIKETDNGWQMYTREDNPFGVRMHHLCGDVVYVRYWLLFLNTLQVQAPWYIRVWLSKRWKDEKERYRKLHAKWIKSL